MAITTSAAVAMGISAATAGASFAAAAKQRKLQKEAMEAADKAMAEAKAKLNVNYFDALAINKEPYELQREASLAQGAQAIEAAKEADRGAVEAAGRVQMAQNQAQEAIRSSMGKEMMDINKLQVAEDARLAGLQSKIGLAEAEGAQQAAADANAAANNYIEAGFSNLGNIGTQALAGSELYTKKYEPNSGENKMTKKEKRILNNQGAQTDGSWTNPFDINPFSEENTLIA